MTQYWPQLWLIPTLPLIAAVLLGALSLGGAKSRLGANRGLAAFFAVLFPAISFVLTVIAASKLAAIPRMGEDKVALGYILWEWFAVSGAQFSLNVQLGLMFDNLTSLMLLFITGIGSLIVLYSVGYMWTDRGFIRFMAYLNLFLFSMITLVLGDSLPVTFLGWEGVGLCSYLLVGFWHHNTEYNDAARKAFIVNRVGDLGFLLGLFALYSVTNSLNYRDIATFFQTAGNHEIIAANASVLGAACLLLFLGCTGKSAQIPLVTWLPDAMAGPTPVSALIHAATMVTAGVFLITRLCDVFVAAPPYVLNTVLIVGCLTAVWGAIAGLVQTDIKKALAYSTVSQLGFMFMACGAGAFDVAIFHVFTHAFFKATLFLGAGSVIHALHHEQDMRKMGGLTKLLPATYAAMWMGWAAIIGIPLFSGFWSKEQIFHSLFHADGIGPIIGIIAVSTALITAIYMTRMMYLTFWSPSRVDAEVKHHIHESPVTMILPILVLAMGSFIAGVVWMPLGPLLIAPLAGPGAGLATDLLPHYLAPIVGHAQALLHGHGEAVAQASGNLADAAMAAAKSAEPAGASAYLLPIIGTSCALIGLFIARAIWSRGKVNAPAGGLAGFAATWTWMFDRWLNAPVMVVVQISAWTLWVVNAAIDLVIQGFVLLVRFIGDGYALVQRPRVRTSLALSICGALALVGAVLGSAVLFWLLLVLAAVIAVVVLARELHS